MASRYYCPACGQVAGWSEAYHIATVRGSKVRPHFLASSLSSLLGEPQDAALRLCPGGLIDKAKDKAP